MAPSAPTTFEEAAKMAKEYEGVASPMPLYRCHEEVWALKIRKVILAPLPSFDMTSFRGYLEVEGHFAPVRVSGRWLDEHQPQAGGYLVFHKYGYPSYSPAQAFEEGYTRL